jgi:uncharacterized protein YkwD
MKSAFVLGAWIAAMTGVSDASFASSSVSFPADSLAVSGCPYNAPTGDGGVALYCAGDIHGSVVFPAGNGTYQINIVARGDLVYGMYPNAQVSIDGVVVGNISVTTASYSTFTLDNVSASAGSHTLKIAYTNDYYSALQDQNLYIQSIAVGPNGSHLAPGVASNPASSPDAYQQQLLGLINGSRAGAGLAPYTFSAEQSSGNANCVGSFGHSVHMQQVGQISHDQFPQDLCIPWSAAGENVGEAGGGESQAIQSLHQQMMNEGPSGGHYQNIMSRQFTTIGIGLYYANGVLWLTEDFVKP